MEAPTGFELATCFCEKHDLPFIYGVSVYFML